REAAKVLTRAAFAFTQPLAPDSPFLPFIVDVRFEPARATAPFTGAGTLAPAFVLHGAPRVEEAAVVWELRDSPDALVSLFGSAGGLVVIDLDCDYLSDAGGRPVSGSAGLLARIGPPLRPGGIFRTWIQVKAG